VVCVCVNQENAGLREQLEDAQAQLLSRHVMEGQQLLMNNNLDDASLLNLTHDQVSLVFVVYHSNNNAENDRHSVSYSAAG